MKIIYALFLSFLFTALPTFSADNATPKTDYTQADDRAKNAPEFEDMPDLVRYLIQPFRADEKLKARVIFMWIATHIQYDAYKADNIVKLNNRKKGFVKKNNPYQTRLGVCDDIATLFVQMALKAHLNCEKIVGHAGYNLTKQTAIQSPHAWNAVKIKGKWYLLDATWAMGGQYIHNQTYQKQRDYKKMLSERRKHPEKIELGDRFVDESWFLTPPEEMIKTHFPNSLKWQLLKHPVESEKIWKENQKKVSPKK